MLSRYPNFQQDHSSGELFIGLVIKLHNNLASPSPETHLSRFSLTLQGQLEKESLRTVLT